MKVTSTTDLHEFILLSIFCFLPAKFIIRCRCVCKDWANLICQPYFPLEYLTRGKAPLQLLLEKDTDVILVQLDESSFPANSSIAIKSSFDLNIRRFFCSLPSSRLQIFTCQATGWILAVVDPYSCILRELHDAHLYNAITGQHIVVQLNVDHERWQNCALILAQKTNQLKLLIFHRKRTTFAEAAIQTIGTNLWRSIGEVYDCKGMPIFLNGRCHWLNDRSKVIISFDAEEEAFQVIHMPVCSQNYKSFNLGSLEGCLCLILITSSNALECWVMNKYCIRDSWTKICVFSVSTGPVSYNWKQDSTKFLEPLTYLKGELLMLVGRTAHIEKGGEKYSTMISYNPHSRKYRYVGFAILNEYLPMIGYDRLNLVM
ncbi:hypothetical protein POM88_052798 [Heracleum sosnowskyi]|uniref:F-box protein n=1 Tax=Heracleum sosnowskyi TaxID=360622 RepID=A0AAD8GRP6_9APIA|nr:hypothetical protein POM88_052798 [Heracleum sosnowskyi]